MKPKELRELGVKLFGEPGLQSGLAEALGIDRSTVTRWLNGSVPIPNPAAVAIRCLADKASSRPG